MGRNPGECQIGYTHYHSQTSNFTDAQWNSITNAVKQLLATPDAKNTCFGSNGDGTPTVDDEVIVFNGNAQTGECHETFLITKNKEENFSFCKTAYKPYDLFVVATLCIIHEVAPNVLKLNSDGDASDWVLGLQLAESIINKKITNPIKER